MAKLTAQQKKKLPVELQIVLERFQHEPMLLNKLKSYLGMAGQKIQQQSLNHSTFCDGFQSPQKMVNELLKLYGMTAKELKLAMAKIGFIKNAMYTSTYYQAFSVAYLIGLDHDDPGIRKLSLMMIAISLWNGRKIKAFPRYCDDDVARYVMHYMLPGHNTYKKAGLSAFDFIDKYSVPAIDDGFGARIADNLDHDAKGLRYLVESTFGRYIQLFRSMKKHYYKAMEEGKKEVTSSKYGQQHGDGEMVESRETFSGNVERLVDKIEKNAMLKKNVLIKPEIINEFKKHYPVGHGGIKKIQDWIEDEDNSEELNYFYELVFGTLKPKSETDICKYDAKAIALKITSSKKDKSLLEAKKVLDHALTGILGEDILKKGTQTVYRAKAIIAYALVAHAKIMLCKTI